MNRFFYTQEMIDYVREIAPGRYNKEIAELFNKRFNQNKSAAAINSMKKNYKITSGKLKRRPCAKLFTEEQEKFIKDNVKGIGNQEMTDMVNRKFGTNYTKGQVESLKHRRGWSSGLTGRFEKGHKTWNKGNKGYYAKGMEKGWFKKGQAPTNYRPIGSERITVDGYTEIKIADPSVWVFKHSYMWEQEKRALRPDEIVIFLDNDKSNITLNNLEAINRSVAAIMSREKLFTDNKELTRTGILLAKLILKTNDFKLKRTDVDEFNKYLKIAESNGLTKAGFIRRVSKGATLKDAAMTPKYQFRKGVTNG